VCVARRKQKTRHVKLGVIKRWKKKDRRRIVHVGKIKWRAGATLAKTKKNEKNGWAKSKKWDPQEKGRTFK